jgi:hypothetical protein
LEEEIFYDFFAYLIFKEIGILGVPLLKWKKYGRNQCKLVVISKIWPLF